MLVYLLLFESTLCRICSASHVAGASYDPIAVAISSLSASEVWV
jgi:hypothetical protein